MIAGFSNLASQPNSLTAFNPMLLTALLNGLVALFLIVACSLSTGHYLSSLVSFPPSSSKTSSSPDNQSSLSHHSLVMFLPLAYCSPPAKALYKHLSPAALFDSFLLFLSSYLPCLGGCAHEGGLPRIGPCIAQRGGTIRSTAFGSLTGVFFGTFHTVDSISLFSSFLRFMRGLGEEVLWK